MPDINHPLRRHPLRRPLIEALTRLPGWQDAASRRDLLADLSWGLAPLGSEGPVGPPWEAAQSLADLALASEVAGAGSRFGGMVLGLPGLIEDLRELGAEPDTDLGPDPCAAQPLGGVHRCWAADPYPGLLPLEHWQAPIYFGRRAETRALLRRLADPTASQSLLVTGVKGSGKSSLLGAGVRGWLAAGGLPGIPDAERWLVSALFPAGYGGDPFLALTHGLARALETSPDVTRLDAPTEAASLKSQGAEALARLGERVLRGRPANACWVLLIDQLEELFTLVDPDLADDFFEMLVGSRRQPRLRVLASLSPDLLAQGCTRPWLIETLNQGGLCVLGPPRRASLERMIVGPLTILDSTAEVTLEPELVARLLDDTAQAPDALTLIADALKGLYSHDGSAGRLTLQRYQRLNQEGFAGGLARRVDRALMRAGAGADAALGELLSQLVHLGSDGTASRRRADYNRVASHPQVHLLVQSLADEDVGLVRVRRGERPTVELAQEGLLREWPALRRRIGRQREALCLRSQVERDARVWLESGRPPQLRWRDEVLEPARALLAEAGLIEDLERDPDLGDFLMPESDWRLAELHCASATPVQREEVGLRLAEIGDPREGVGLTEIGIPAIQWCALPPGEVRVEGRGLVQVPAFRIAAVPVTQLQFESFVHAEDGFARAAWWNGLSRVAPPSVPSPGRGNYPATRLSWFDAMAFCRWLSARTGLPVRLPDEWEWQWAAQSARPGFVYPWGRDWRDGHANTEECALGRATAVGLYPAGRSLQGVYDLAGNTWEWCRNGFDRLQDAAVDTGSPRVLKGGSWRVNRGFARADFRLEGLSGDRMAGSSFRLVLGP